MTKVRRLGTEDVASARALNALFGEVFDDPKTYIAAPPADAELERRLACGNNIALVAEADGEMVGGLVAYVLEKFEQAYAEIYIYDLAVRETHRRRGIATALIGQAQVIAEQIGAWVIFVQGDYGDEPALALYDKLGTREEVLHFDIAPAKGGKTDRIV